MKWFWKLFGAPAPIPETKEELPTIHDPDWVVREKVTDLAVLVQHRVVYNDIGIPDVFNRFSDRHEALFWINRRKGIRERQKVDNSRLRLYSRLFLRKEWWEEIDGVMVKMNSSWEYHGGA